ncbi:MAG: acyl carrier protein [Myxococcales bacterium]
MSATRQQVSDRVLAIVAELTNAKVADIKGTDRLREDLGLDSMQSMEMLSRVSEEFEVDPDMEKAMQVQTIDEVVNVLAQTIGAA